MTVATGFTKVELSGTGDLRIEKTGTESLTISAEDNILPRLTSKVSGDTLILGTNAQHHHCHDQADHLLLDREDLTGLALSVSRSIRVPNLRTTALSIKISGSGMITANGTANDQYLEISGSGAT